MKKKVSRASKRRLLIFGTISCLLMGYFFVSLTTYAFSIARLQKEQSELEEKLLSLKEEEQNLKTEIQKLQDPEYIARYARENYLYSKDGEYIIKIEKDEEEEETTSREDQYYYYIIGGIGVIVIGMIIYVVRKARR